MIEIAATGRSRASVARTGGTVVRYRDSPRPPDSPRFPDPPRSPAPVASAEPPPGACADASARHAAKAGGTIGVAPCHPVAGLGEACLQDIVSPVGGHAGLLRGLPRGPLVWIQDGPSRAEFGGLHARGMVGLGFDPSELIVVRARRPVDALWAMEEALRAGLPVVGEIEGCPRALDFTATRRLEVRARAAGVSCFLVRTGPKASARGASGARRRWRVLPHPGAIDPHDPRAPGGPRWVLELTRARDRPPGAWVVEAAPDADRSTGRLDEHPAGHLVGHLAGHPTDRSIRRAGDEPAGAPHRLRVVAALADGGVAPVDGTAASRDGSVVPLRPGRAA